MKNAHAVLLKLLNRTLHQTQTTSMADDLALMETATILAGDANVADKFNAIIGNGKSRGVISPVEDDLIVNSIVRACILAHPSCANLFSAIVLTNASIWRGEPKMENYSGSFVRGFITGCMQTLVVNQDESLELPTGDDDWEKFENSIRVILADLIRFGAKPFPREEQNGEFSNLMSQFVLQSKTLPSRMTTIKVLLKEISLHHLRPDTFNWRFREELVYKSLALIPNDLRPTMLLSCLDRTE